MQKKYQCFVSSTYKDLIEERNIVSKSILDLEHIPAGMELFAASDSEQLSYIKRVIDECDYYILIIAGKYGSTDDDGISYTEREYDYALETGKTVLAFVKRMPSNPTVEEVETDSKKAAALQALIQKASKGRMVRFWSNREELASGVIIALTKAFRDSPQVGWVRGDQIADDNAVRQINELQIENRALQDALRKAESLPNVVAHDVAKLDESFVITVLYSSYSRNSEQDLSIDVSIPWSHIALGVLYKFNDQVLYYQIGNYTLELALKHIDKDLSNAVISDYTIAIVCNQLEIYGFIERDGAKVLKTKKGKAYTQEQLTVRSGLIDRE